MKFKKPKFWDLKKPNLLAYLLSPLTLFVKLNNLNLNLAHKKKFNKIKTICIGNIYLGGTGKTPTTLKIYELLKKTNLKIVTGKKFYSDHKDEQIILKNKSNLISLDSRINIIEKAIDDDFDLIIFDDGLQEKKIDYNIKFVCFDAQNWIGNGFLIPSGPLREGVESLKKYDGIFLKHNNINTNAINISSIINKINPNIKIFNSYVTIKNINKFDLTNKYLIFSSIGNQNSFKDMLIKNNFKIIEEIVFPDHYNYNPDDIIKILNQAEKIGAKVITTEKDFVKISDDYKNKINYIEIDLNIPKEEDLIKFINSKIYETN
jgi:tetraacyldisaccharide 4'-kinase